MEGLQVSRRHDQAAGEGMTKPYLSPTQLDMYARCPEAYRRRYIEGEIVPPGIAMIQGGTFHRAAARNFEQKIGTHTDLPVADMKELAASEFELGLAGGYSLTDEEVGEGAGIVIGEAKDQTIDMVEFHARRQAPEYQPILVEEKVRIELAGNTHDLLG